MAASGRRLFFAIAVLETVTIRSSAAIHQLLYSGTTNITAEWSEIEL
jgi:hypothetical protein